MNTRFGGAFPAPAYAALPGRTYPELIVALAAGETVAPHVGEFDAGMTFTRYYWQLELDPRLRPTGREIVPGGPPATALSTLRSTLATVARRRSPTMVQESGV